MNYVKNTLNAVKRRVEYKTWDCIRENVRATDRIHVRADVIDKLDRIVGSLSDVTIFQHRSSR